MRIFYDADFDKALAKLPADIQRQYRKQEAIFRQNWRDPRLHIKKLINHPYPFSFRVTRSWRTLFILPRTNAESHGCKAVDEC